MNPIYLSDGYKPTHWAQDPPQTTSKFTYLCSRGGMFDETVFFGLQYQLKKYLAGPILSDAEVSEAMDRLTVYFGGRRHVLNEAGWRHIVSDHGGRFPVRIRAVPEGTVVPTGNVLMAVENTCDQCSWVPDYVESLLLQIWYPITVATLSREIKKIILRYLEETGDPALVHWKLHDFGFRGVSSVESAGIGGAAHLVNFSGSDTLVALPHIHRYYGDYCAAGSIPASQHSTVGTWGRDREFEMFAHMLDIYDDGVFACVSDTYNIWNAVRLGWGRQLRGRVMNRNGTVVVRPDSGVPEKVVLRVLEELGRCFPVTINTKGYKVLDPHVRIIQGDGVNRSSIERILEVLKQNRWSADNIAFGMGGALLQGVMRDDQRMKIACSHAVVNGTAIDVYKDPITDQGKRSIPGRIKLVDANGTLITVPESDPRPSVLQCVFENGEMRNEATFNEVRARAELPALNLAA